MDQGREPGKGEKANRFYQKRQQDTQKDIQIGLPGEDCLSGKQGVGKWGEEKALHQQMDGTPIPYGIGGSRKADGEYNDDIQKRQRGPQQKALDHTGEKGEDAGGIEDRRG